MQFLIRDFYDSDNINSTDLSRYLIAIEDDCLILKFGSRYQDRKIFRELFKKSFDGWHNIRLNMNGKYDMNISEYIRIETDILTQFEGGYEIKYYKFGFRPLQLHNIDKFFEYLNNINEHGLSEEQSKKVENLKKQELEAKQREKERLRKIEEEKSKLALELRKQELEAKKKEEERLRRIQIEKQQKEEERLRQLKIEKQREEERLRKIRIEKQRTEELERQRCISEIIKVKEDRELEKIFLNYFDKYIKKTFLYQENYSLLKNYLLTENYAYEKVKANVPMLSKINIDYSVQRQYHKSIQIDLMIEFMERRHATSIKDCAKLLTWIEICDVAISYYSNCFYELYGKQLGNIDNLNLNDSIFKYIHSDIICDEEETRNHFIYFLISSSKFEEEDVYKGYINCKEIFNMIYDKLKKENEFNNFVSSLLVDEKIDEKIYTIEDLDLMTGNEFEMFIGEMFKKMGYKTTITKASGDQGIDVIAEKNSVRYGIQAKCYSNVVSNSAIQEAVAGISFYKCDKAMVVTNNDFTNSAIELAKANEVVLWNREMLKQKIRDLFA